MSLPLDVLRAVTAKNIRDGQTPIVNIPKIYPVAITSNRIRSNVIDAQIRNAITSLLNTYPNWR